MGGQMLRSSIVILAGLAAFPPRAAQAPAPSVVLSLPGYLPSETVQLSYHLVGPFGGQGGSLGQKAGVHSYEIPGSVEGQAATEIKVIVYAPGCELQAFAIAVVRGSRVRREFPCQRVRTVQLVGQIVPNELVRDDRAELVITYMAYWAHEFYGIADGMVTEFRLATLRPDANGVFQVDLPYFSADAEGSSPRRSAGFRLLLRDAKTWNLIAANLEPQLPELRVETRNLPIRSHYPAGLRFANDPRDGDGRDVPGAPAVPERHPGTMR